MRKYSGVGSRLVPGEVINNMVKIAEHLASHDWLLRSGGADGADLAFEAGCDNVGGLKEIYLPWQGFNKSASMLYTPTEDAFVLASTIHPAWDKLTYGGKKLHARNCHQVLGLKLDNPVDLLICWTPRGKEAGGTATAIKLAKMYKVQIINLAVEAFDFIKYF